MNKEQLAMLALQATVEALIGLFHRHQQGENVSADLNELLTKVQSLKDKETAIANAPIAVAGAIGGTEVTGTIKSK